MELLNSIKKQRELFSHDLSTAKMPNELEMDNDASERRPLSPRNKKAGVNDTRQLVSSLRSKREDLVKRYERAQQAPNTAVNVRPENEENTRFNNKAVVDMSLLESAKDTMHSSLKRDTTNDLSARVKSFQDKMKNMEELEERPKPRSIVESLEKFEGKRLNIEEPSEGQVGEKATKTHVKESWRRSSEERDSTARPSYLLRNDSSLQKECPSSIITTSQTPKSSVATSLGDESRRKSFPTTVQKGTIDASFPATARKGTTDTSWIRRRPSSEEDNSESNTKPDEESPANVSSTPAKAQTNIENYRSTTVTPKEAKASFIKTEDRGSTETSIQTSYKNKVGSKIPRKHVAPSTEDSTDTAEKPKTSTPSAPWIKQSTEKCIGVSNSCRTLGQYSQPEKKFVPTPPSWTKKTPLIMDTSDPTTGSAMRRSLGSGLAVAGAPARGRKETEARRKSVGDLSWIKRHEDTESEEKPIDSRPKAPWVRAEGEELPLLKSPTMKRTRPIASSRAASRPGPTVEDSAFEEESGRKAAGDDSNDESNQEPHSLALSDKVSLFESAGKSQTTAVLEEEPKDDVQTIREKWKAVDKSLAVENPIVPLLFAKVTAKPAATMARTDAVLKRPPELKTTPSRRVSMQAKPTKISNLISKMEKFSQGGEFECDESVGPEAQNEACFARDEVSRYNDEDQDMMGPQRSYEPSQGHEYGEYGDANFSFDGDDQADESPDQQSYLFEESDEASEGSTYKIDNYHKEFNETIPIDGPWMHPHVDTEPRVINTDFDEFGDFTCSERNTMTILSIAPCRSLAAPSYEVDETGYAEPTSQEQHYRDQRPPRSLATRRTYHQVARNCLLSKTPKGHKRSKSVGGFVSFGEEADPIFLATDDSDHKSSIRIMKKFILSRPRDDEGCNSNSQEENKPSKSVFNILKKGLGSSSSSKKDDAYEHTTLEGTHEETAVDGEYHQGFRTDASRTTISSITRSVTSGDSNKPVAAMPLGVLNGFFKAARKLQKKSKKKPGRGRSVSNYNQVPTGMRAEYVLPPMPPTEVQLWPNPQVPDPTDKTAVANPDVVVGDRRFGAYGGLAASRSKALNTAAPEIQSMASW